MQWPGQCSQLMAPHCSGPLHGPIYGTLFCPEIKCGEACQGSGQRPAWEFSLRRNAEVTAKGPAHLESLLGPRRCVRLQSPECESCLCLWVASACDFLPPLGRQPQCSGHCGPWQGSIGAWDTSHCAYSIFIFLVSSVPLGSVSLCQHPC